jgi:hypothetical protein
MIQRLIDFYRRFGSDPGISSIWSGIINTFQGRLTQSLKDGNNAAVQAVLDDPKEVLYGLDNSELYIWGEPKSLGLLTVLARRIGVLSYGNPLQPSPTDNTNCSDAAGLKSRVAEILGPLGVPNGFVFQNTAAGVPTLHLVKLGQWFTIKSLMRHPPKRVLEIGAGTGGLALIALNNGVHQYTIVDIPSVAVLSAYFLSKAFGEDKLWMLGEPACPGARLRWFPSNEYSEAASEYDLITNCNSFPEMTRDNQMQYMNFIYEYLGPEGLFYSCNHESDMNNQRRVRDAVQEHGGFRQVYRAPSMIRDGYLEEVWKILD